MDIVNLAGLISYIHIYADTTPFADKLYSGYLVIVQDNPRASWGDHLTTHR